MSKRVSSIAPWTGDMGPGKVPAPMAKASDRAKAQASSRPSQAPQGRTGRCFETHPPLVIGDFKVYGGSCSRPIVTDADIYVGFDLSHVRGPKAYPWVDGESFLFHIQDMHAPADPAQFKKLIEWLSVQLIAQKKIHLGCIGGHGRTGTVLAALVAHMTGEADAITYVREHYCQRAVESAVQVSFLHKHFGIKAVAGAKDHGGPVSYPNANYGGYQAPIQTAFKYSDEARQVEKLSPVKREIVPTKHPMAIWSHQVTFDKLGETGIIQGQAKAED